MFGFLAIAPQRSPLPLPHDCKKRVPVPHSTRAPLQMHRKLGSWQPPARIGQRRRWKPP